MTHSRERMVQPPGDPQTLWRSTLKTGAKALQNHAPLQGFDVYVVGFHCARDAPSHRADLLPLGDAKLAHPQSGVNLMSSHFPTAHGRPDGVRDIGEDR